ncbi:FAD-binding protein [Fodinicola acaciae]|uniref:FAD-binding protein n=1 Tax=Fodinicola acaciae TaxID=2681555 RepID=UPI0013D2D14D|nr:FAD-binding protein [Fodinicola acaciae]
MAAADETYDVVVVGSGGGGLVGAYLAASRGLRTLVVEKTGLVGGTTAYSGAGLWFPGSAPIERAGVESGVADARTYLRHIIGDRSRESLQDAYLDAGVRLIDELEKCPRFGEFVYGPVPDYYAGAPGATAAGRTVFPQPLPVADLGTQISLLRRNIYQERWGIDEGPVLSGGRALIGRALSAFRQTRTGSVRVNTALERLIVADGRVVGLGVVSDGERTTIHARRGVILAAGGFERDAQLRAKHQPPLTGEWSNGAPGNTGDALRAGIAIGAATELLDEAWFVPGLVQPDGTTLFFCGTRGGFWVDGAGERFVNETAPYDQVGHEIMRRRAIPTHWVLDQRQLDRDSFGGPPDEPVDPRWFASGALKKADTLAELARLIDVPYDALSRTVQTYNGYAESGVDKEFHRGETPWDLMQQHIVGFPALPAQAYPSKPSEGWPNPLLPPLDTPPYYVATIVPADIGTKGGLKIDEHARVLREDGTPIAGLYAAGNTAAPMSGRVYPGAGTPIGSSLAFGYLAVLDIAGT